MVQIEDFVLRLGAVDGILQSCSIISTAVTGGTDSSSTEEGRCWKLCVRWFATLVVLSVCLKETGRASNWSHLALDFCRSIGCVRMTLGPACNAGDPRKSWTIWTTDSNWNVVELNVLNDQAASRCWLRVQVTSSADTGGSVADCRVKESDRADCKSAAATGGHIEANSTVVDVDFDVISCCDLGNAGSTHCSCMSIPNPKSG